MADTKPARDFSIFSLLPAFFHIALAAIVRSFTSLFRGSSGAPTYRQDVSYAVIRQILSRLTVAQSQGLSATTQTVYEVEAKRLECTPRTVDLGGGAQGHWIGSRNADNVMVFFHGGGYIGYATTGHIKFQFALQQAAHEAGHRFAIFSVSYTLAPHKLWPNQLSQATSALRYLIEEESRDPQSIFIGGDSAGGNLTSALLLHLARPHPDVAPLELRAKLHGALLISPWISFDTSYRSFTSNAKSDYLTAAATNRAASTFIGPAQHDAYSEPIHAPADWWAAVAEQVVEEVMIWGGGGEVLIDSIRAYAGTMAEGFAIADAGVQSARTSAAQRRSMAVAKHLSGVEEAAMKEAHWTGALHPENAAAEVVAAEGEPESAVVTAEEVPVGTQLESQGNAEAASEEIDIQIDEKAIENGAPADKQPEARKSIEESPDEISEKREPAQEVVPRQSADTQDRAHQQPPQPDQHDGGDFIVEIDDAATRRRLGTERVFYIETPRASHEEQIMNHTLKIKQKAPSAAVIEDWLRSRL